MYNDKSFELAELFQNVDEPDGKESDPLCEVTVKDPTSYNLLEIKLTDKTTNNSLTMMVPEFYKLLLEGKSNEQEVEMKVKEDKNILEARDLQSKLMNGLHFASIGMNVEVLKYVIDKIKNKHAITIDGYTALHIIAIYGNTNHVKFKDCYDLLLHEIHHKKSDFRNMVPLGYIRQTKCANALDVHLDLITKLVPDKVADKAADKNKDKDEYYELFRKLREGKEGKFVDEVLSCKRNLERSPKCGITLLQLAVYMKRNYAVSVLLHKGFNPNEQYDDYPITPLDLCIEKGDADCFKLLIADERLVVNNPECKWVKICELGNAEMIKEFIRSDILTKDELKKVLPFTLLSEMPKETILTLLDEDVVTLADRDESGTICAAGISKIALAQHLDYCIQHVQTDKKTQQKQSTDGDDKGCFETKYEFNYKTLMPNYKPLKPTLATADKYYSEVGLFMYIVNQRPDLQLQLLHNVIKYFILMKWRSISNIFYTNLSIHIVWCILLILSIFVTKKYFQFLIFLTFFYYIGKDIMHANLKFLTNWCLLFKHKKIMSKYIFIFLLVLANWNTSSKKVWDILSAIALLIVAYQLLACAGQHTKFSTIFCTFQSVLDTFLAYLLFYLILIIPFALSFHILFRIEDLKEESQKDNVFNNAFLAIFKTLSMLSGEIDTGDIEFDRYPVFSHIAFLCFIFVVVITLMNLLNGVAVSETKKAQDANELNAIKAQLRYIYRIECWMKYKLISRLLNLFSKDFYFFKRDGKKTINIINNKSIKSILSVNKLKYTCDKIYVGRFIQERESKKLNSVCSNCNCSRQQVRTGIGKFEGALDTKRGATMQKQRGSAIYTYNENGNLVCTTCNRTFKVKQGYTSHQCTPDRAQNEGQTTLQP